jgi:hypothetical protein
MASMLDFIAQGSEPAGGAPTQDLIWGGAVAAALTVLALWVCFAHRTGRIQWLGRLADFAARIAGLPRWAALPSAVTGGSLLIAAFGFYWDVAQHIDHGRDPGPFGTVAHYPILIGLAGIALGGLLALVLGTGAETPTSIPLGRNWNAPLGGVLIFLCGLCALTGFPLDDVWHRLFGQDVTLWGPTHILMVGGASLSTLGAWVLLVEGARAQKQAGAPIRHAELFARLRTVSIAGGFLIGLSTLQGEFDYGVPQFQLVYQPILIAFAAGIGLVAARVKLGRGGALGAAAFYLVGFGTLSLIIGPIFGMSTLHFPLYIAEAVLVELVAWRISRQKPLTIGVVSGALIGTVGFAAEWGWTHLWMPLPWPSSLLPEAAILALAAGLAGGVIGGFVGRALLADGRRAPQHAPRGLLAAAVVAALVCIAWPLPMDTGSPTTASVALRNVAGPPHRAVAATVRLTPSGAAAKAQWLTVTAWQGGGLVVDRLQRVGDGVYRTTQPIPVYGKWKAMLRMENGRAVVAVPIYLPADPAIPAKGVPASAHFTRPFVSDKSVLQREARAQAADLAIPAYVLLAAIVVAWLVSLGFGLRRLLRTAGEPYPDEALGVGAGEGAERDVRRPALGAQT